MSAFVLPLRAERRATAVPRIGGEFERLRRYAVAVVQCGAVQHVLLAHGGRRLQLAVRGGDLFTSDCLFTDIPASRDLERRLGLLRRLNHLCARGELPARPDPRARRLAFALQVLDGWLASAPQREIAHAALDHRDIDEDWRDCASPLRDRLRFAIRRSRWLMEGGYLSLLK